MVAPGSIITKAQLDALAALANSKSMLSDVYTKSLPPRPFVPYEFLLTRKDWLAQMSRMRADTQIAMQGQQRPGVINLSPWRASVSGPWPIAQPDKYFNEQEFYYRDTGQQESADITSYFHTLDGTFTSRESIKVLKLYGIDPPHPIAELVKETMSSSAEVQFYCGGDQPAEVKGRWRIDCSVIAGGTWEATPQWVFTQTSTDDDALGAVNITSSELGESWTKSLLHGGGGTTVVLTADVDAVIQPNKIYKIKVTGALGNDAYPAPDTSHATQSLKVLISDQGNGTVSIGCYNPAGDISSESWVQIKCTKSVPAAAIDSSKNVFKIALPKWPLRQDGPFGMHNFVENGGDAPVYDLPPLDEYWGAYISTSCPGLWKGLCYPAGSINNFTGTMPWEANAPVLQWNGIGFAPLRPTEAQLTPRPWMPLTRYNGLSIVDPLGFEWKNTGGTCTAATEPAWPTIEFAGPVARLLEPGVTFAEPNTKLGTHTYTGAQWTLTRYLSMPPIARWSPLTRYGIGAKVMDNRGNTQVLAEVDGIGTTSGISGDKEPEWGFAIGDETGDMGKPGSDILMWRCWRHNLPTVEPATARPFGARMPRYPFAWWDDIKKGKAPSLSGMVANSVPATVTQPSYARWIHRVWLHRVAKESGGFTPASGAQVPVTLGCVRNGAFVPFGTYSTGSTFIGMWPVFTNDFLAYQCTERVDVQASVIENVVPWGTLGYPIQADFYNDIEAVVSQLS